MKVRFVAVLVLMLGGILYAQDAEKKTDPAPYVRSALEQRAYDQGRADVEKERQKVEAEKVKAQQDAEAKKKASIVTYTALDRAYQEVAAEESKGLVGDTKKLIRKRQKLMAEIAAIDKQLEAANRVVVSAQKVAADPGK